MKNNQNPTNYHTMYAAGEKELIKTIFQQYEQKDYLTILLFGNYKLEEIESILLSVKWEGYKFQAIILTQNYECQDFDKLFEGSIICLRAEKDKIPLAKNSIDVIIGHFLNDIPTGLLFYLKKDGIAIQLNNRLNQITNTIYSL